MVVEVTRRMASLPSMSLGSGTFSMRMSRESYQRSAFMGASCKVGGWVSDLGPELRRYESLLDSMIKINSGIRYCAGKRRRLRKERGRFDRAYSISSSP